MWVVAQMPQTLTRFEMAVCVAVETVSVRLTSKGGGGIFFDGAGYGYHALYSFMDATSRSSVIIATIEWLVNLGTQVR